MKKLKQQEKAEKIPRFKSSMFNIINNIFNLILLIMSMYKSKPEMRRMPMVEQTYDIEDTIGVASRRKYLEDMKLRIEEAENRAKNVALRNDWVKHQKQSLYQGQLDDINRQLERPMMPVKKKEELMKRQNELKTELKLRPTYDELVGMIESQGDPNRPPIEKIIDRRATIFRNNQFGSQFDNVDFLGLKKQEEDKLKEEMRQTQLRQTAIARGTSVGMLNAQSSVSSSIPSGATTPFLDFGSTASGEEELIQELDDEQMNRIRAELERFQDFQRQTSSAIRTEASSELREVGDQEIPDGVVMEDELEEDDEMPELESIPPSRDTRGVRLSKISKRVRGKQTPTTEIQPSTSSSSTAKDILVSGAKAGVETLAKAGATALAKSFLPV